MTFLKRNFTKWCNPKIYSSLLFSWIVKGISEAPNWKPYVQFLIFNFFYMHTAKYDANTLFSKFPQEKWSRLLMMMEKHIFHHKQGPWTKSVNSFSVFSSSMTMADNAFWTPLAKDNYRMDSKSWQSSPLYDNWLIFFVKGKLKSLFLHTVRYNPNSQLLRIFPLNQHDKYQRECMTWNKASDALTQMCCNHPSIARKKHFQHW